MELVEVVENTAVGTRLQEAPFANDKFHSNDRTESGNPSKTEFAKNVFPSVAKHNIGGNPGDLEKLAIA